MAMLSQEYIINTLIQNSIIAWEWPYAGYAIAISIWLALVLPNIVRRPVLAASLAGMLFWGAAPWIWSILTEHTAWAQHHYPVEWWQRFWISLLTGGGVLAALTFLWARWMAPRLANVSHRLTRKSGTGRSTRTDTRNIEGQLPRSRHPYNPRKYFKHKRGVFAGLNATNRAVYIPYDHWKSSHVQIVGSTGFGKGVIAGILLAQALERGEAVVVLDPKNDEWGPHVLKSAAESAGKPFHFVDLRSTEPQLNLLGHASAWDIEERLLAAFSLGDRGEAADYYRIADRRAARSASQLLDGTHSTLSELYQLVASHDAFSEATGFLGRLEEMATLDSINAKHSSVDLERLITDGGCLYVVGSMRHARVISAQRMLMIQLIQIAEKRARSTETRPLRLFLDEVKYHISRPALEALGAARDKGIGLIIAHQSIADLRDCPADLNGDTVVGAVVENCGLRFAYRIQDPATAEWLAAMSGTILVDDEVRRIERNTALAESVDGDRVLKQSERYYIDTNMFLNLPKGCAALLGLGTGKQRAQLVHISPLRVEKQPLAEAPNTTRAKETGYYNEQKMDGVASLIDI